MQCLPDHLARVSPLIVVPAHDFDEVPIHYPGHTQIHNGGIGLVNDVRGHNGLFRNRKDLTVAFAGGLLFEKTIDLRNRSPTGGDKHDIGQRSNRHGDAHRYAIELPLVLR